MQEFIEAFRQTSYYRSIIERDGIVAVVMGGSRALGLADERSDYDIYAISTNGNREDVLHKHYFTWRGVKGHLYIDPIPKLFDFSELGYLRFAGNNIIRLMSSEHMIYENPKYADTLQTLYDRRNEMSDISIYHFYYWEKQYIDEILDGQEILKRHHSKKLYHLCLSSYLITGDEADKDFLRSIKRIRIQEVPEEYKKLAIERLRKLKECIESPDILLRINPERSIDEIMNGQ